MDTEIQFTCTLCGQRIGSDESRRSWERQLEILERQEKPYDPCLECGEYVPSHVLRDKTYRARVRNHVKWLRELKKSEEKRRKEMEADAEWPAGTPSLVGDPWAGWCPVCVDTNMYANTSDYYECPKCRLQICIAGYVSVLRKKGTNKWWLRGTDRVSAVDELPGIGAYQIEVDGRA